MGRVVIDGVQRYAAPTFLAERFAGVGVNVKSGKVTAGDVESNAVPTSEDEGGWIHLDCEFGGLTGDKWFRVFERVAITGANDAVSDVEIDSSRVIAVRRVDIDQLGGEVCVR